MLLFYATRPVGKTHSRRPRIKKFTNKGIVVMTKMLEKFAHTTQAGLLAVLVALLSMTEDTVRAVAISMEAEVVAIDLETREVSLKGPDGDIVTLHSPERVVKLEDMNVGDRVVTSYIAALEGEVREPTEEELAEPWLVVEEAGVSKEGEPAAEFWVVLSW